ncbi:hypothetical protein ORV05_34500 [Amycolatopsis cynarae]|uniref:Uncharacterized protein n=1 Tax=Amycolatopsis cynarae TaxID=2995223 RepID=A0ABY7B0U6_9PSEU|nr:hypothetical protein [Amycolatopsis sp. HUAS 11-8]WAL65910.1 hypothetical protein ORV05_34500 [Amycolatopsis sp. HUAS 11-8]
MAMVAKITMLDSKLTRREVVNPTDQKKVQAVWKDAIRVAKKEAKIIHRRQNKL